MVNEKIWNEIFKFAWQVIRKNGETKQIIKAAEELGELQQECFKALTGRGNASHISEEIADVLIILMQLKGIYDISSIDISEWVEYKIARERERMGLSSSW